jgi:ABC-2 type transport system permease protein
MSSIRVFFIGGLISYRSLFNWLSPWILIPTLIIQPICQVLLFAYIGKSAGVGNDQFYVMGNALSFASIPCLFAMGSTIEGERWSQTLGLILATPARRIPLFLGRSLPVIVNGWGVAIVGVLAGVLLLHVDIPAASWPSLLLVLMVASASCTGLGLAMGAVALRVRQGAVISNVGFCVLLVFTGVNVAQDRLPTWMAHVGSWLPLTHGIEAARSIADGASLSAVSGLLERELGIGVLYAVAGLLLLHVLERESRRHATLERI